MSTFHIEKHLKDVDTQLLLVRLQAFAHRWGIRLHDKENLFEVWCDLQDEVEYMSPNLKSNLLGVLRRATNTKWATTITFDYVGYYERN